ncbi:MAG: type III-B CRISPR module RAMP protein Cmr4 [Planctomycetota bacterium]
MKTKAFLVHALSPLHAGTGHAVGIVDLPTARMRATGIPFVPGSSIKGVLRDARESEDKEKTEAVFGPRADPSEHAGAIFVADARLLALPVRSYKGTFAWATCPLLLSLAKRDLGVALPLPAVTGPGAWVVPGSACVFKNRMYLEELDLEAREAEECKAWADELAPLVSPGEDIFARRFAVLDDDTMAFLWDVATQIDARVRIDESTRTVAHGALWLEESLPPETVLVGLLSADRSRRDGCPMEPEDVLDFALRKEEIVQLGGKASTGRGRCRLIPRTKD